MKLSELKAILAKIEAVNPHANIVFCDWSSTNMQMLEVKFDVNYHNYIVKDNTILGGLYTGSVEIPLERVNK